MVEREGCAVGGSEGGTKRCGDEAGRPLAGVCEGERHLLFGKGVWRGNFVFLFFSFFVWLGRWMGMLILVFFLEDTMHDMELAVVLLHFTSLVSGNYHDICMLRHLCLFLSYGSVCLVL